MSLYLHTVNALRNWYDYYVFRDHSIKRILSYVQSRPQVIQPTNSLIWNVNLSEIFQREFEFLESFYNSFLLFS